MQKQNISPDLYERLVKRVNQASSMDMVRYPTYHKYATMNEIEMTQGYHEQINQLNVNDPDLLDFPEGVALGRAMVEKDIDFEKIRSVPKYYQALVDKVEETFNNQELKEYFTYSYLRDKINYGGGIDEIEDQLSSFYSSASNNYLVRTLKREADKWADLTRGKEAPNFSGTTREGELVKLSDLKGKNVYIDVWATWCGPCIREIPSLKEVEHDYEDKNVEFVSISIDAAKDYEKWEKFVEEKELGGTQLFAANDWKSEVATSYNIRGIPRFILIDEEGKIVRADAPRPSSPELRELLSEIGI
ncbi:MAG: TlpA family protein disulfide reductase [Saprospiraceae bacterium]|nr:TlpA family protein disulfide reductase [Saprospiraceae bacterium]